MSFEPLDAFKWSFDWCRSDIARVVLPILVHETVVLFATLVAPRSLGALARSSVQSAGDADATTVADFVGYSSSTLFGIVTLAYATTTLYPYLLNIARGRPVEFTEALRPASDFVPALKMAALFALANVFSLLLCALPTVLVAAVSAMAFPALVDRGLSPLAAIRLGVDQVRARPLQLSIFGLLCLVMTLIGAAACIVGAVFVAVPVVLLAQVYAYMRLHGEQPVLANLT